MQKYAFSIRTRSGQFIERIVIAGRDQKDAERKLNQMYHHCEVVHCNCAQQLRHGAAHEPRGASAFEDTLSLISR
jgi:hypothetical protein